MEGREDSERTGKIEKNMLSPCEIKTGDRAGVAYAAPGSVHPCSQIHFLGDGELRNEGARVGDGR